MDVVSFLVKRKADINILNFENNNVLHLAAFSVNVEIIKLLLVKWMSVNLTSKDDSTPLHI